MDIQDLEKLARTGEIAPLFFVIAARQVPGYDIKAAKRMEDQYFDGKGFPVTDEDYKRLMEKQIR